MKQSRRENLSIPEITLSFEQDELERCFLTHDDTIFSFLAEPVLRVRVQHFTGQEKIYPVFQQNAMKYDEYSDYMRLHGCACCSLTTLLAGMRRLHAGLWPQDTIRQIEDKYLPWQDVRKNYEKSLNSQMPISLYGISKVLSQENIFHRYIGYYKQKDAYDVITRHLLSANPVVFETSRIRYKNGWIRSVNDRKYAGSYHTMIMLGMDRDGKVLFTDSANREWAGTEQRIKRAELSELMSYMFPQKKTEDTHVYFHSRRRTGGFILVYAWGKPVVPKIIT